MHAEIYKKVFEDQLQTLSPEIKEKVLAQGQHYNDPDVVRFIKTVTKIAEAHENCDT